MSVAFDEIRAALMNKLYAYQTIDIAWPNVKYVPVKGTGYLEPILEFGEAVQAVLGTSGKNKQVGILQILVWEPVGKGLGAIMRKADEVITQFKRGTDLTKNSTIVTVKTAGAGGMITMGDWVYIPVTINWYSYTAN